MPDKYRMLLKDGDKAPIHWTEILAARPDMKEAMMTAEEISAASKPPPVVVVLPTVEDLATVAPEIEEPPDDPVQPVPTKGIIETQILAWKQKRIDALARGRETAAENRRLREEESLKG